MLVTHGGDELKKLEEGPNLHKIRKLRLSLGDARMEQPQWPPEGVGRKIDLGVASGRTALIHARKRNETRHKHSGYASLIASSESTYGLLLLSTVAL